MNQILCSTGALLGKPNGRNYRLLEEMVPKLECDGFEFMVYSSWYPEMDELISTVRSLQLNIPVIHCQKALGETLCGMKVWREGDAFPEYVMTKEEDEACFLRGLEEFAVNLEVANAFGAGKMVLHLWNGLTSDKHIEKNIERFGRLREMALKAGVDLMVENVLCNAHDPLSDLKFLRASYEDVHFTYDTKMAEFHGQTMKIFEPEWDWILKEGHITHLHINDYGGGYMDWGNLNVLPLGKGHVDLNGFFRELSRYGYQGDYTIEATGFDRETGEVDFEMLNGCFRTLRTTLEEWRICYGRSTTGE